ncbi:MAG: gluconate 2-dehydrogenase subunit 3 family protein, partial [Gemmataceae bacterium]|nr:gluconate 2-dehydrogenase subunit 3 family protein [Gemmataceae bacterium]
MNFDAQERALLGQLADVLIPAGEGMPSASEAGVAAEGLDAVVAVRPDLIECLKTVLKAAAGR